MGAVQVIVRQIYRSRLLCEVLQHQWKGVILSVVLSIGLRLTDDTEISIRAKTRTNSA